MRIIRRKTGADVVSVPDQNLIIVNPDLTQTGQVRAIRQAGIGENTEVVRGWVEGLDQERRRRHRKRTWNQRKGMLGGPIARWAERLGKSKATPDDFTGD
ncbi:hypothetical protein AB0J80_36135 [Actinoplanes sp. NPDC049548]|uniref:hypothetical protein n=1 Tax=Actinoplanes sp. NPDC049548 TaxID=3155152 RepID=UPI0034334E4C